MGSFADAVRNFATKTELKTERVITSIISEIASEVIERTPIDTGRAKANWLLAINSKIDNYDPDVYDPDGNQTYIKIVAGIPFKPSGNVFWVMNNTPYIMELENGKSKQAPMGIVRLTKLKFKTIVRKSVNELKH